MSNQRYPEEFKIEAVKQVTERGLRVADVAERLLMASMCHHEQWLCSRKRSDQCSSKLLSKHGLLSRPGYTKPSSVARTAFSRAGCTPQTIYPLVNTLVSSKAGCKPLALIRPCMALTQ